MAQLVKVFRGPAWLCGQGGHGGQSGQGGQGGQDGQVVIGQGKLVQVVQVVNVVQVVQMVRLHRIDYMPLENTWFTWSKPSNYLYYILHACDGRKCESSALYCIGRIRIIMYYFCLDFLSVLFLCLIYA